MGPNVEPLDGTAESGRSEDGDKERSYESADTVNTYHIECVIIPKPCLEDHGGPVADQSCR